MTTESTIRIHILYDFKEDEAWGGGNQFLKALRNVLKTQNQYAETIQDADVILINSHHKIGEAFAAKKKYPEKHFVHRIGSIFTHARNDSYLDVTIQRINNTIADGTIFQSGWSRDEYDIFCTDHEGMINPYRTVIPNAPDPKYFHPKKEPKKNKKIRIVTTAWATGSTKGHDILEYLNEQLDFSRYEFWLLGNYKSNLSNFRHFPPAPSSVVGETLRLCDIFFTPVTHDSCSNSLVEGLHCGLPAVARNSGGNPELVLKTGSLLFNGIRDVLKCIDLVASDIDFYSQRCNLPDLNEVADRYYQFCESIVKETTPKKYSFNERITYLIRARVQWVREKLRGIS